MYLIETETYGGTKRTKLKNSDFVLSSERKFPVMIAQDVKDAVSSWGRYKGTTSFDQFKKSLTALAKRKGLSSALPKVWNVKAKESNTMSGLAKLKAFIEKGAKHTAAEMGMIQDMHDNSVSLGATCGTNVAESAFSRSDELSILSGELKEDIDQNAYILDVFDTYLVYATGYSWSSGGSESYKIDYTVQDNGDVTWGAPIEVVRQVTYVPTNEDEPLGESAEIDITTGEIALVEYELIECMALTNSMT